MYKTMFQHYHSYKYHSQTFLDFVFKIKDFKIVVKEQCVY